MMSPVVVESGDQTADRNRENGGDLLFSVAQFTQGQIRVYPTSAGKGRFAGGAIAAIVYRHLRRVRLIVLQKLLRQSPWLQLLPF
jgi:hypothetical protein